MTSLPHRPGASLHPQQPALLQVELRGPPTWHKLDMQCQYVLGETCYQPVLRQVMPTYL